MSLSEWMMRLCSKDKLSVREKNVILICCIIIALVILIVWIVEPSYNGGDPRS
jgi:hypothetical protein